MGSERERGARRESVVSQGRGRGPRESAGGVHVRFEEFEELAWRYWEEIPEAYKEGIDGLIVERDAMPHPTLPEIYTLGECITEAYPSEFGGPETIRSAVALYYGSFWRLSRSSPDFDWEEELWETLTHELQHHLESLADEDALVAMDYAMDENFKRLEGEPFDPFFYRSGERIADRVYRVERDYFVEYEYGTDVGPGRSVEFSWHGVRYRVAVPGRLGDVCFLWIGEGLDAGPGAEVSVVLVRRRGFLESMRGILGRRVLDVVEAEAIAEPVPGGAPDG